MPNMLTTGVGSTRKLVPQIIKTVTVNFFLVNVPGIHEHSMPHIAVQIHVYNE